MPPDFFKTKIQEKAISTKVDTLNKKVNTSLLISCLFYLIYFQSLSRTRGYANEITTLSKESIILVQTIPFLLVMIFFYIVFHFFS